ncbi:MAG: auxin permease family transport protein [Thermoleophilia bacterium]|nr:auxin permease family transport protein [Thermoleophilia bacterium]
MLVDLLLFAVSGAIGLRLQLRAGSARLRERLWSTNYVVLIPLAAAYAFLSIRLDRELLAVVACGVGAWWLTVLVAGGYAAVAARTRPRRGALWLVAAFPNTGFIGFPLANLAYGRDGLRLAVVYDQVSLVVPAIVVATVIAGHYAEPSGDDAGAVPGAGATGGVRAALREVASSPPLWTVLGLLVLRATVVHDPVQLDALGTVLGHVIGPVGFLLLGLSLPLGGFAHRWSEVAEVAGAAAVRIAFAPAALWLVARLGGADVPHSLYLIAAMPTAFHALVLARLHGLEAHTVRLGLLASSAIVVVGTVVATSLGAFPGG